MTFYVTPALLKSCSLAFAICKCLCIFSIEVTCLALAPDLCLVSLKSDVQLCLHVSPGTAAQNLLMSVFIWSFSFGSPFLHSSWPPTPECCLESFLHALETLESTCLKRWRGALWPTTCWQGEILVRYSGLKTSERADSWVCGQLCITSSDPQYFAEAVFWELSTLPSFCSLITKGLTIKMLGCNAFNTLHYTLAAKTNTNTTGSDRVCSAVAQVHRPSFQTQRHLPREAVNLMVQPWHVCPGSPPCLSLSRSLPGRGPLKRKLADLRQPQPLSSPRLWEGDSTVWVDNFRQLQITTTSGDTMAIHSQYLLTWVGAVPSREVAVALGPLILISEGLFCLNCHSAYM